jgi:hypothetical protein
LKSFTEFIGHDLAEALHVPAETHPVSLDIHIPHFCQKAVGNRIELIDAIDHRRSLALFFFASQ